MKIQVRFIVARLNENIVFVEAIQDMYTTVQIILNKNNLDEVTCSKLVELGCHLNDRTFYLGEQEAKDIVGVYGNMTITIESKEIEYN